MTPRSAFQRKLIYLAVLVGLMLPLAWLGMPASSRSEGGTLAVLRKKYQLNHESLGSLDPTSETVRLSALGLRGLATALLWQKADDFRKKEDWSNLMATIDTIVKLQPHYISVWRYQGWNVAYNISVEWDDYRDRYYWVMRGVHFLENGTRVNQNDPSLLYDTGWTLTHKIGRADEHVFFRQLFQKDPDFHPPSRPFRERDNWLVGKEYYRRSEKENDKGLRRFRGTAPVIYHSTPALANYYYAMAIQSEGQLDERATQAWDTAYREWAGTGQQPLSLGERLFDSYEGPHRLNDYESVRATVDRERAQLDELVPGARAKLAADKLATLTPNEARLLNTPEDQFTQTEEYQIKDAAQHKTLVTDAEIAALAAPDKKAQSQKLVQSIQHNLEAMHWINSDRGIVNFNYWRTRARSEQTRSALAARRAMYLGQTAFAAAELEKARDEFEDGLEYWRVVLDDFPALRNDVMTADELLGHAERYRYSVLQNLEQKPELPKGYGFVSNSEVLDWERFARWLLDQSQAPPDSPGSRIWETLSRSSRKSLERSPMNPGKDLDEYEQGEILFAINSILQRTDCQQKFFPEVMPSADEEKVLQKFREAEKTGLFAGLPRRELRLVNRKLLERALPELIRPARPIFALQDLMDRHPSIAQYKHLTNQPRITPAVP